MLSTPKYPSGATMISDKEYRRIKKDSGAWKRPGPLATRKSKLKMRFQGERLDNEIKRTAEKLSLLLDIKHG